MLRLAAKRPLLKAFSDESFIRKTENSKIYPLTIMKKTVLYQLFRLGRVPKAFSAQIQQERLVLHDEGICGSLTFRNFRAPGKRCRWKRLWFDGAIVLTHERLFAFMRSRQIVGVSWDDPKIKNLNFFLKDDNLLCIEFDASTFEDS